MKAGKFIALSQIKREQFAFKSYEGVFVP